MPDVSSPRISHVQYDRDARVLIVTFRDSGTFRYFDVPEDIYQDMLSAHTADDYFNANVYGRFKHVQQ